MKNSIKKLVLFAQVAVFVFMFSCADDFLDVPAKGAFSSETLMNEEGLDGVLIGAYSLLDNGGSAGGGWPSGRWIFGGVTSDDAHTGTEAGALQPVPQYESYSATSETPGFNDRWRFLYSAVQRSNDVLRLHAQVVESGNISEEKAEQIEAEAKFLRGLYHLEIAMMWRNVPYIDETISSSAGNYLVPNTGPIWDKIEADFQFAASHLSETKADVGRANSWAAKAFLAKTYMFQHKFTEANTLLTSIIDEGMTPNGLKYDLLERYYDNFRSSTQNGAEQVFAIQHSVKDGGSNSNTSSGEGYAGPFGGPFPSFGFYQPSFSLANSFKTDAVTGLPLIDTFNDFDIDNDQGIPSTDPFTPYQGTLDARIDYTIGRRGIPYLDWGVNPGMSWVRQQSTGGPYLHMKHAGLQAEPESRDAYAGGVNYNMIRFADVLLWAAEAEVEVGSLAQAEIYVNRVRARAANPDGWVKTYIDPSNPLGGLPIPLPQIIK
ncbi:MAG: RagB/SusD family nutrient uptake outer membrane protein [Flavobacteriaceae bacterium]